MNPESQRDHNKKFLTLYLRRLYNCVELDEDQLDFIVDTCKHLEDALDLAEGMLNLKLRVSGHNQTQE